MSSLKEKEKEKKWKREKKNE